jgi:hypothetical protein
MADFEIKVIAGAPVIYVKSTGLPYAPTAEGGGGGGGGAAAAAASA